MVTCKYLDRNDKVRVLTDLYDPQNTFLSVTADSIGRIMSFEEYCAYIERTFDGKDTPAIRSRYISQIAKAIQDDGSYIVRIENFAPVSDSAGPSLLEDIVATIPAQYLEKVEG